MNKKYIRTLKYQRIDHTCTNKLQKTSGIPFFLVRGVVKAIDCYSLVIVFIEIQIQVYSAKSMVDTKPPQTYVHMHLKLKKLQLEEEKMSTIERDNRILLEKMSHIMRTQGRVDNRNDYDYKRYVRYKICAILMIIFHSLTPRS